MIDIRDPGNSKVGWTAVVMGVMVCWEGTRPRSPYNCSIIHSIKRGGQGLDAAMKIEYLETVQEGRRGRSCPGAGLLRGGKVNSTSWSG